MKRTIALTCKLEHRETPTSFASRLAMRNASGPASEFCLDMGLTWEKLIVGDANQIQKLAWFGGAEPSALQRYAFRSAGPARLRIGWNTANNRSVNRTANYICPLCIVDSVNAVGFPGGYKRADWQFCVVRTCHLHHVGLIRLPPEKFAIHAYNIAAVIRRNWDLVREAAADPVNRAPNRLEHYIRTRLEGKKGPSWIDSLPLPVVCKASELLGLRQMFGPKIRSRETTVDQQHQAGSTGFDILAGGQRSLLEVLERFKGEFKGRHSYHNRDLGIFYVWLTSETTLPGIEILQNIVREFIVNHYPIMPGTTVLHRIINQPRCIGLATIEKSIGIRQDRLAHMLAISKDIKTEAVEIPSYVTHQEWDQLREQIHDMLSYSKAAREFGCSVSQITGFATQKMIRAYRNRAARVYLSRQEVEEFFRPINEVPLAKKGEAGLVSIALIHPATGVTYFDAYQAFLHGKLSGCRRNPDTSGFVSLLVNREEVKAFKRSNAELPNSIEVVSRRLCLDPWTLTYLIRSGELRAHRMTSPQTGGNRLYIEEFDIEQFEKHFISNTLLAKQLGLTGQKLHHLLLCGNIQPRDMPQEIPHRYKQIYRRENVATFFKS